MDDFKIILYGAIGFNLIVLIGIMFFVRYVRSYQRTRQRKLIEQAKLNSTLEQTIRIKEQTLDLYRNKV